MHNTLTDRPTVLDGAERINKVVKWNAMIDDSLITVTSLGHTVYLDGTVGSWTAMNQAVDNAWSAPGVREVVNHLTIEL